MTLKRLRRITVEAVRICPGPAGEPEIGIGSGATGSEGLHLGGYPLPHHSVAAEVAVLLLTGKGRRRRRGGAEEEEGVRVVVEVAAGGAHERGGVAAAVSVGGGSIISVGA